MRINLTRRGPIPNDLIQLSTIHKVPTKRFHDPYWASIMIIFIIRRGRFNPRFGIWYNSLGWVGWGLNIAPSYSTPVLLYWVPTYDRLSRSPICVWSWLDGQTTEMYTRWAWWGLIGVTGWLAWLRFVSEFVRLGGKSPLGGLTSINLVLRWVGYLYRIKD